jgi:hypothetical protein
MVTFPRSAPTRTALQQALLAVVLIAVPVAGFSAGRVLLRPKVATADLGDMTGLEQIVTDVRGLFAKGDLAGAKSRITDFETTWDSAETTLRARNQTLWTAIDDSADAALHAVRAAIPDAAEVDATLTVLKASLAVADAG